jgi:periplasmic protein TonB
MAQNNDLFSKEWCDFVFDPRYREYGGYELRTNSYKRHIKSLLIASSLFILLFIVPFLVKQMFHTTKDKDLAVRVFTDIKLEPPKEEDVLKEVPPPPQVLRNTVKFEIPDIKPDEQVSDEPPLTQKEVLDMKAAIGNTTFDKGSDDVSAPPANADNAKVTDNPDVPLSVVDQMPQFPGGEREMLRFIKNNLRYPLSAQENNVQGTVILNFVVDREGKIVNIKVVKAIGFGCDEEAVRVMEKMPNWTPGKQRGQPVLVSFTMPFRFVLN